MIGSRKAVPKGWIGLFCPRTGEDKPHPHVPKRVGAPNARVQIGTGACIRHPTAGTAGRAHHKLDCAATLSRSMSKRLSKDLLARMDPNCCL